MSHDSRLKGITISKKTSGKGVTGIIIKGTPEISCDAKVTITLKNTRASIENSFNAHIKSIAIKDNKISNATVDKDYNLAFAVEPKVSVKWSADNLPNGLKMSSSNGKISGKPTEYGTFEITIYASSAFETVSKKISLTIKNAKPELTTTSIPSSATVGKEYSANISATHNPTSWILLGTLPDGLNFNTSTGAL